MADRKLETFQPATRGLDTTSSPGTMQPGFAPVHRNFLVHREGVLPMRGPIVEDAQLDIGDSELIAGMWVFNDKVLISRVTKSSTATREPWTAPYRKAAADTALARADTTMKLVDLDADTVSNVASAASSADIIGGRGARLGAYVYGLSYDVATGTNPAVSHSGGYIFERQILRWDGTTTAPTVYSSNSPEGGQDVIAHLNRLWVLGGIDRPAAGTTMEWSSLFFSDDGGPETASTASEWQDDATGLTNKIVVDSEDPNDFGVGLAKSGQNLMIFKRRSVHILYGFSPSTFTIRTLSSELGCVDRRSIVEHGGVVYWLSDQGFHSYDGNTVQSHDAPVETTLLPAIEQTVGNSGGDGGRAVATKLPNEYLLLSVSKPSTSTGVQPDDSTRFCALYHTPSGRWTHFSSDAPDSLSPIDCGKTTNYHFMTDGSWIIRCQYLTQPEVADEADRGFDFINSEIAARENLCTNPRVASDTTGWSLTSAARGDLTDEGYTDFTANGTAVSTGLIIQNGGFATDTVNLTNGTSYMMSVYVMALVPGVTVTLSTSGATTVESLSAGVWTRVSMAKTATSTSAHAFNIFSTGGELAASAVLIEAATVVYPYVEGSVTAEAARYARIPALWWSHLARLSNPGEMVQLHRLLMDYSFAVDGDADGDTDGWYVSVYGGDGTTLISEFQVPGQGDPSSYIYRRRDVVDAFTEAHDAQVRVEWKDDGSETYPALVKAELYDVNLEYQDTRQRRSS